VASACIKKCYHCKSGEHLSTSKQCPEYIRQTQIKKVIVFENISYQEVNHKCPKQYTNKRDFHYNPSEQRPGSKRRYEQVVRNQAKRRITQDVQPYNKDKHNESLLYPNGRSPPYENRKKPRTQVEPIYTTSQTTNTPLTQQTQPPSADHRQQNRMFSQKRTY